MGKLLQSESKIMKAKQWSGHLSHSRFFFGKTIDISFDFPFFNSNNALSQILRFLSATYIECADQQMTNGHRWTATINSIWL